MEKMDWSMNFEQFTEFIKEKVQTCLGEGICVQSKMVMKSNGVKSRALQISQNEKSLSPVIYMDEFFKKYEEGKDVASCVKEICDIYVNNQWDSEQVNALIKGIKKWKTSKEHVYPILLPREGNEELLESVVYRDYLDLALCYCLRLDDEQNGTMSVRVNYGILCEWGVSEEELYAQAFQNMKYEGYYLMKISQILREMGLIEDGETDICDCGFSILTNQKKLYGAAGILDTRLLAQFAEMVESNLFLLPSSVHEMIVIPDDGRMNAEGYKEMIREVNATMLHREERLSDHPYYFDWEKGEVRVVG